MADERKTRAPAKRAGRKTSEAEETPATPRAKAPRPQHCRKFARARTAEAMPELVGTLIEKSQEGSLGHMRLLVQLSGLDEAPVKTTRRRSGGTVKALMEEWHRSAVKKDA